jgi:hypothetical protein
LSPDIALELVNPAAILSRQARFFAQTGSTAASSKALKTALGLPM